MDLKMMLTGVVSEELFADLTGIAHWSVKPRMFAEKETAASRLYPSLCYPVAKEAPLLSEPNHAPIIT